MAGLLLEQIDKLNVKIRDLEKRTCTDAGQDEEARQLMSIPGVGPITAMAIQAFAPPMEGFGRGRDFSAWLGLVPRQHSTGGRQRLGRVSKMGQRDLRRLLFVGAMAEIRWAVRRGVPEGSWLAGMLARKPRRLVGHGHGQPDGAHNLGADDEEGKLSRPRHGCCMSGCGLT